VFLVAARCRDLTLRSSRVCMDHMMPWRRAKWNVPEFRGMLQIGALLGDAAATVALLR
jgi:hypothetical protein